MSLLKPKEERGGYKRSAFNVVLPNRILQRGQVFTWTREVKQKAFQQAGLTAVVNFWPKIDPDYADMGLDWYWQLSVPRSEGMLEPHIEQAAISCAGYLQDEKKALLILCEAGKTRSVFFTILVVKELLKIKTYAEARKYVLERVPATALKGFMEKWITEKDAGGAPSNRRRTDQSS